MPKTQCHSAKIGTAVPFGAGPIGGLRRPSRWGNGGGRIGGLPTSWGGLAYIMFDSLRIRPAQGLDSARNPQTLPASATFRARGMRRHHCLIVMQCAAFVTFARLAELRSRQMTHRASVDTTPKSISPAFIQP